MQSNQVKWEVSFYWLKFEFRRENLLKTPYAVSKEKSSKRTSSRKSNGTPFI